MNLDSDSSSDNYQITKVTTSEKDKKPNTLNRKTVIIHTEMYAGIPIIKAIYKTKS